MRSAEFNKEQVLRAAMQAFMNKGYTKTSMQDLKKVTGLHPGSLYCAFENKQGLLLAAIEQYNLDRSAEFAAFFNDDKCPMQGLTDYLENIVEECISCNPQKACLLQKALNEIAEQEPKIQNLICDQLNSWQEGIAQAIEKAQKLGHISTQRSALCRAQSLVMGIYGLRTYAHTHPEPAVLKKLSRQLLTDVTS